MQAGKLRSEVTIQASSITKDGRGQDIETWADVATVPADVRQLAGRELTLNQQVQSEATFRVVIRYRPDVTTTSRLIFEDQALDITATADLDQRHRTLLIDAREHTP